MCVDVAALGIVNNAWGDDPAMTITPLSKSLVTNYPL
jgi:hypothetical protein